MSDKHTPECERARGYSPELGCICRAEHVQVSGADCACGRCHEVQAPEIVERSERHEMGVIVPPGFAAERSPKVLEALETRAMLIAAEQVCEELGAKLSMQIREFSGNELVAYSNATQEDA